MTWHFWHFEKTLCTFCTICTIEGESAESANSAMQKFAWEFLSFGTIICEKSENSYSAERLFYKFFCISQKNVVSLHAKLRAKAKKEQAEGAEKRIKWRDVAVWNEKSRWNHETMILWWDFVRDCK